MIVSYQDLAVPEALGKLFGVADSGLQPLK